MYIYIYVYVYINMYIYVYIRICVYIHIYLYMLLRSKKDDTEHTEFALYLRQFNQSAEKLFKESKKEQHKKDVESRGEEYRTLSVLRDIKQKNKYWHGENVKLIKRNELTKMYIHTTDDGRMKKGMLQEATPEEHRECQQFLGPNTGPRFTDGWTPATANTTVAPAMLAADSTMIPEATAGIAVVTIPIQVANAAAAEVETAAEVTEVAAAAHMVLVAAVAGEVALLGVPAVAGVAMKHTTVTHITTPHLQQTKLKKNKTWPHNRPSQTCTNNN